MRSDKCPTKNTADAGRIGNTSTQQQREVARSRERKRGGPQHILEIEIFKTVFQV
jgi:hypothetical protein